MLSRRELMTAGVAGSLYPAVADTAEAADGAHRGEAALEQQPTREDIHEIKGSIDSLEGSFERAFLSNSVAYGAIGKVRQNMDAFLRGNGKFPDFMDVGIAVFWEVYDWHIKNRQQLVVTRGTDGRYWMQFIFTTLLLRPEVEAAHIGVAFDKG